MLYQYIKKFKNQSGIIKIKKFNTNFYFNFKKINENSFNFVLNYWLKIIFYQVEKHFFENFLNFLNFSGRI